MRYFLLILISFSSLLLVAQTTDNKMSGSIEGVVMSQENEEPIYLANVRLFTLKDSTYVKGIATDEKGYFRLLTSHTEYFIEISSLGFTTRRDTIAITKKIPKINLGEILLEAGGIELKEAIVEATVPDMRVNGDTIEYNASSYTRDENSLLQDLLKNMPGVEVDEHNNITANGKPITKILVDGKEFFGNDIAMALTNLPANMIKKLQLFKEESEKSKATGFKDKDPDQVINLVVKEELKHNIFGDTRAGYGPKDKYVGRGMMNYMDDKNQASLIGNINNVNISQYSIDPGMGIDKNKNIGVNLYRQTSKKFKAGANVMYRSNDNELRTTSNDETFLTSGNRFSKNESTNKSGRDNFGLGGHISWEIDSLTSVFLYSSIMKNKSNSRSNSSNLSYTNATDTTRGTSNNWNKGDGYSISNNLTITRKLNNKGRSLTFSGYHAYRADDRNGETHSITQYSDGTPNKLIDHRSTTDSRGNNYSVSLSYVEPLAEGHLLQFSYSFSKNYSKNLQDTRRKDGTGNYTILDSTYSRNTFNDFIKHNINIDYQVQKEKYNYTVGLSLEPSNSKSKTSLGNSIIDSTKQKVFNFSPSLNFSYTPNTSTNLDFSYYGNSTQPTSRQISADTTVINAMAKTYGNPNLKQSYDNNFNISYHKSDIENSRFFSVNGSFNYMINNIVSYTDIDKQGNTSTTYRNVTGDMGAHLSGNYNAPFRNKNFTFTSNTSVAYNKNIGFTNAEKTITQNVSLSQALSLRFVVKKFETDIKTNISHNIAMNNLSSIDNRSTTQISIAHNMLVRLPYNFSIQSTISYRRYSGYGKDFKNSEVLWNASVQKEFLKKKNAVIKLQVFDILKDRSNISRQVTSSYISDYRTNTVSRYGMLTFSYRFNINKTKANKE